MKLDQTGILDSLKNKDNEINDIDYTQAIIDETMAIAYMDNDPKQQTISQLKLFNKIISAVSDPKELQCVFGEDETFVASFGDNPENWQQNITSYIEEIETSEEGLLLQEFLLWGPIGLIITAQLVSHKKVSASLSKQSSRFKGMSIDKFNAMKFRGRSIYLPSYIETKNILDGMSELQALIQLALEKPEAIEIKYVISALKQIGIDTGRNPEVHTEWKVVGTSIIANIMAFMFVPGKILSNAAAIAGVHTLGQFVSDNSGHINTRGWDTPEMVSDEIDKLILIIKADYKHHAAYKKLGKKNVDKLSDDKKKELKKVGTMVKLVYKAYNEIERYISRGLIGV